jgi:hypothetical protein
MWTPGSTSWAIERERAVRRHVDPRGRTWDVVVGRESFGALFAIFVPGTGNPEPARQTLLQAGSQLAAEQELGDLSAEQLDDLLERSEPKGMG